MSQIKDYSESKSNEVNKQKLSISYKFIEHSNDYFFLHGLSKEYYKHLTETLDKLQNVTEEDLRLKKRNTTSLNPKPINFKNTKNNNGSKSSQSKINQHSISQSSFPINEDSPIYSYIKAMTNKEASTSDKTIIKNDISEFVQNAFEISLSTNYGRIHGFINQSIFYIIWFDPAHNLFLSKHKGETTKLNLPHEIEKIKPICPATYQEYNLKLEETVEYINMIIEESST